MTLTQNTDYTPVPSRVPYSSRWQTRPNAASATTSRTATAALGSSASGSASWARSRSRSRSHSRSSSSRRTARHCPLGDRDLTLQQSRRARTGPRPTTSVSPPVGPGPARASCCPARVGENVGARRRTPAAVVAAARALRPGPPRAPPPPVRALRPALPARVVRASNACPFGQILASSHLMA